MPSTTLEIPNDCQLIESRAESRGVDAPFEWKKTSILVWLLLVGLAIRGFHFFLNHTIWFDESVLLVNILDKTYLQLLGPLNYEQAAPPLFLWTLKSLSLVFGDNSYMWRTLPFVTSCLTLILTALLVRRLLTPLAAAVVVGMVAFSNTHIWLGCCIKPYALDACIAVGLVHVYVATLEWSLPRRIGLMAALAPLLLCFSYPAVFIYSGLLLALLPAVWRQRRVRTWAAYLGLAMIVLGTFAILYLGPIKAQTVPHLVEFWSNKFPPWSRPATVPGWIVGNTFLVFHYCYNPIGGLGLFLAIVGAIAFWRTGRNDLVMLLAGPVVPFKIGENG